MSSFTYLFVVNNLIIIVVVDNDGHDDVVPVVRCLFVLENCPRLVCLFVLFLFFLFLFLFLFFCAGNFFPAICSYSFLARFTANPKTQFKRESKSINFSHNVKNNLQFLFLRQPHHSFVSVGAMFSSVATVDTFCNFLGAFIFNPMYIRSSKFGFPGLPFLVSAALIIIPLILTK